VVGREGWVSELASRTRMEGHGKNRCGIAACRKVWKFERARNWACKTCTHAHEIKLNPFHPSSPATTPPPSLLT